MKKSEEKNIVLTLNGGDHVLDSATVPVQWNFADWLIKKQPKELLIIDNMRDDPSIYKEERQFFSVKSKLNYIQFHRAGWHRLYVIALDDLNNSQKQSLLEIDYKKYRQEIASKNLDYMLENLGKEYDEMRKDNANFFLLNLLKDKAIAVDVIDVFIPKELFSKEPPKWLSSWVNKWYTTKPVDQCSFRNRKIWAFTTQPILFAIYFAIHFFVATGATIIWLIYGIFSTFFGSFMNLNLFRDIRYFWTNYMADWDDYKMNREWRHKNGKDNVDNYKMIGEKEFLFAPWEIVTLSFSLISSIILFHLLIMKILLVIVVLILVYFSFKKFLPESKESLERKRVEKFKRIEQEKKKKEKRRLENKDEYLLWLKTLSLKNKKEEVDISDAKYAFDKKALNVARIFFWATKAKVCKPYAKK